jgi:prevent-host-death family protein
MKRINASAVREDFADILNQVAYAGERIILHRRGKNVAAIVSIADLQLLQDLEDRLDNAAADAALSEPGESIPWERVKQELDLE